jgi:hypothetical protein
MTGLMWIHFSMSKDWKENNFGQHEEFSIQIALLSSHRDAQLSRLTTSANTAVLGAILLHAAMLGRLVLGASAAGAVVV